jgi:altronate dehydratase
MIFHPNVGAVLMVSLGCEVNPISKYLGTTQLGQQAFRKGKLIVGLEMQSSGGTRKTIEAGVLQVEELIKQCQIMKRTPQPLGKILLGANCGGRREYDRVHHGARLRHRLPSCAGHQDRVELAYCRRNGRQH